MFKDEIKQSVRFKNIRRAAAARIAFSQRVKEQAENELKDLVHFHETPHRQASRRFGYQRSTRYSQRAREFYEGEVDNGEIPTPDWYHESTIDVKLQELSAALKNAVDYMVYDNVLGIDLESFLERILVMKLTDDDYTLLEPILTTVYSVIEVAQDGDMDSAVNYAYEGLDLIADFLGEDTSDPLIEPDFEEDIAAVNDPALEEDFFFEEDVSEDFTNEEIPFEGIEDDEWDEWENSFSGDENLW